MSLSNKEQILFEISKQYKLSQKQFNKARLLFQTPRWIIVAKEVESHTPILITFINVSSEGDHHEIHFACNLDWSSDVTSDEKRFITTAFKHWAKELSRIMSPFDSKNYVRFDILPPLFDRHLVKGFLFKAFSMKIKSEQHNVKLKLTDVVMMLENKQRCLDQWRHIPNVNQMIGDIHSGFNDLVLDLDLGKDIIIQLLPFLETRKSIRFKRNELINKLMLLFEPQELIKIDNLSQIIIYDCKVEHLESRIQLTNIYRSKLITIIEYWINYVVLKQNIRRKVYEFIHKVRSNIKRNKKQKKQKKIEEKK